MTIKIKRTSESVKVRCGKVWSVMSGYWVNRPDGEILQHFVDEILPKYKKNAK